MAIYIIKRAFSILFSILIVTIVIFYMMHSIPGGPFDEEKMPLSQAAKDKIMKMYGLDQPLYVQYLKYMWNALHLEFGRSYQSPGEEMVDLIKRTFRVSAFLGGLGLAWAIPAGLFLGIISAVKPRSLIDYLSTIFSSYTISVPVYVSSIFLIFIFSLKLGWFPTGGFEGPKTWIMPVIAYGLSPSGIIARYTRSSMVEVLNEPYIVTAKSKGLPLWYVIIQHAFRNAMIPILTIMFPMFTRIVTGSIFIERIFRIPGLGGYFVSSIYQRDYPLMMTLMILIAVLLGLTYLFIDVLYTIIDPRIQLWRREL
ncbi:MAG TPA: ABC transporter permease [Atribacterota bacterium]|nr:ABC transporter permease [Atribacterota bacterium]